MIVAQLVDEDDAKTRLEGFKKCAGWNTLNAVKNNQLFGAYHGTCRTILDGAMIQFYAKAMYPELFADLDPETAYLDFYRKYMPVIPEGMFVVSLN